MSTPKRVVRQLVLGFLTLVAACSVNSEVSFIPDEQFGGEQTGGRGGTPEVGEGGVDEPGGSGANDCSSEKDARCSVDGILEVCKSGVWTRERDCGHGLCSASRGACLSCAPGSFTCQRGSAILKQCNLDGSAWDVVRTCDSSDACFAQGDVGFCKVCAPGAVVCDSTRRDYPTELAASGDHSRPSASLRRCNEQGSGTVALDECGLDASVCDASAKACRGCIPGQALCEGGALYVCNASESHELVQDCGHAALCDAATRSCKRSGCQRASGGSAEVDSVACEKSALSICRSSGKWDVLEICEGDAACSAGLEARLCLNSATHCLPGTSSCAPDQQTLQQCAEFTEASASAPTLGTSYVYAHCASGCLSDAQGNAQCAKVASPGSAFSDELVCVPGSSHYLTCGSDGCTEAECGAGRVCADSELGCRNCVPGALRCDGARLLRCDSLGVSESLLDDCGAGVCDKIRGGCLPARVGERYCDAGLLRSVGVDGTPQTIEDCGAAELCDAKAGCKPAYCVAGSISCRGAEVLSCEDGTQLVPTRASCESEERCEEGLGCAVAARIAAGDSHTCALIVGENSGPDATGYVKCWGANESGQLGNGASVLGDEPQAFPVVSRAASEPAVALANFRRTGLCAGKNFSCADITLPGGEPGVACWGANDRGQLGIGGKLPPPGTASVPRNRIELPVARAVSSSANTFTEVAFAGLHGVTCGSDFACALDANQLAFCWGSNEVGQLGTGQVSPAASALAVPVWPNLGALRRISAGGRHACAIDASKRVWCWGDNSKQQLGQRSVPPATPPSDSPVPLRLMELVADELSLGRDFSFALSATAVLAWGQNGFGQLSTGNSSLVSEPSPVLGVDAASTSLLASGPTAAHACAIVNSWLWCWGANPLEELGDGSRLDRYQPVAAIASDASDLPGAAGSVALGKAHTCAVDGAGNIWCWGANQRRQLGRASVAATAPVRLRVY